MSLTITIPTYNRPKEIQAQVRRLIPQLKDGVKLVIKDNCSEIPVADLFDKEELDKITIIRNNVNIGGDANIVECIRSVDSGWVWTLSDDDVITSNSVDLILRTIRDNRDCCYINFCAKKEESTTGITQTLDHLKIYGAFGVSFFITASIFNVDQLKASILWYYIFLSTQIGQIFMVIKHLELHPEAKCFFSKESIVERSPKGNWSPLELITNSSLAIDKFYYCRKQFQNTLFVALANMYLSILIEDKGSIIANWHYYNHVVQRFGFFNLLFRNTKLFCGYWVRQFVPSRLFWLLRSGFAKRYNKRISA